MSDRPTPDFGARLKTAREARGVSLRRIANVTKISIPALEALERNDISKLPGGIFTRAFVRSYAAEVGLDPEETVHGFITSFPQDSVVAGHPQSHEREERQAREHEARRFGRIARFTGFGVVALAAIVYLAVAGFRSSNAGASGEGALEAAAAPIAASAVVPTANTGSLPDGTNGDLLSIRLAARGSCWVSATVDGRRSIQRLMEPGEQTVLHVRSEIVLTAGDAGALAVTINGLPLRPLGRSGQVVTVRIDPGNYRSFIDGN
jgi:transcriptional regulator with XRE-family HTH domain